MFLINRGIFQWLFSVLKIHNLLHLAGKLYSQIFKLLCRTLGLGLLSESSILLGDSVIGCSEWLVILNCFLVYRLKTLNLDFKFYCFILSYFQSLFQLRDFRVFLSMDSQESRCCFFMCVYYRFQLLVSSPLLLNRAINRGIFSRDCFKSYLRFVEFRI